MRDRLIWKVPVDVTIASLARTALDWKDQDVPGRSRDLPSRRITDDLRRRIQAGEWDSGQ